MDLKEYQPLARRTMKELPFPQHIEHMSAGITGELGELIDQVKKNVIYGKPLDIVNVGEEAGDGWWYNIGLVPELGGHYDALQEGFNAGLGDALLWTRGPIPLLVCAQAQIAGVCHTLMDSGDGVAEATGRSALMIIGRNMGRIHGHFNLDLSAVLETNIAKLAKRYGDKFSDVAALNRDLGAERAVLDAGLSGSTTLVAGATPKA